MAAVMIRASLESNAMTFQLRVLASRATRVLLAIQETVSSAKTSMIAWATTVAHVV
jgi:hypothetical protein